MKYLFSLCLVFLLVLPSAAQTPSAYEVVISDVQTQDRLVSMKVRVINTATGQEVGDIKSQDLMIYQDGSELRDANLQLSELRTDAFDPEKNALQFDQNGLIASGATVGIVVDLSQALNQGAAPGTDYVNEIRQAAEMWITQGNAVAARDPEQLGLFIPLASNSQSLQPAAVKGFQYDHNLVIVTIRQEPARAGATDLYDAVLTAIEQTTTKAQERGTPAYVVIFSDGTISGDSDTKAASVLSKAEAADVQIIAFGIGNPSSLESDTNRLPHIAPATGGEYVQVALDQREAKIAEVYKQYIKPVDRSGYFLDFYHTAPVDNQQHTFQVKLTLDGQEWSSPILPIPADGAMVDGPTTLPLADVQKWYLIRAIPLAIVIAGIITALSSLVGLNNRRSVVASVHDSGKTRA